MDIPIKKILELYDISDYKISFICYSEHIIYKVVSGDNWYVLRIHKKNPDIDFSIFGEDKFTNEAIEDEIKLLEYLDKHSEKIKFQHIIPNKENKKISYYEDYAITILSWIYGKNCNEVTDKSSYNIGVMLAELHKISREIGSNIKNNKKAYDIEFVCTMQKSFEDNIFKYTEKQKNAIKNGISELKNRIYELKEFEYGLIHGDFSLSNIIINSECIYTPIDFSLSSFGYYYQDISRVICDCNENEIKLLISGYESVSKTKLNIRYIEAFNVFQTILYIVANQKQQDFDISWLPSDLFNLEIDN